MSLTDHVNDDTALLHQVLQDRLGLEPDEARSLTLDVLDTLGGRTCYLPSGAKARKSLAKEKARALLDQGLGPDAAHRRIKGDDDVGDLSLGTVQEMQSAPTE